MNKAKKELASENRRLQQQIKKLKARDSIKRCIRLEKEIEKLKKTNETTKRELITALEGIHKQHQVIESLKLQIAKSEHIKKK